MENNDKNQDILLNNEKLKKSESVSIRFSNTGHKLTTKSAVLAIISTIVGGGIVSLPHSIYFTGIIFGLILIILSALQTTYSVMLYLKAKDYLPGEP